MISLVQPLPALNGHMPSLQRVSSFLRRRGSRVTPMNSSPLHLALVWLLLAVAAPAANLTGEWNFDDGGNLGVASTGANLTINGTAPGFSAAVTDDFGQTQNGVILTRSGIANRLSVPHGIAPNGGGPKVNKYTVLVDVFSPATSRAQWRDIFQTNLANTDNGDYFISTTNSLGVSESGYSASNALDPARWKRLVVTFDLGTSIKAYEDGVLVHTHTAGSMNGSGSWMFEEFKLPGGQSAPL